MTARDWVQTLIGGGAMAAGLSGLLIAGRTMANVDMLTDNRPVIEERIRAVETELYSLRGAVQARAKADAEGRQNIESRLQKIQDILMESARKGNP